MRFTVLLPKIFNVFERGHFPEAQEILHVLGVNLLGIDEVPAQAGMSRGEI